MVRKIKIVEVYTKPEAGEEATTEPTPSDEATHSQASDTEHEPPPPPPPETKSEEGEQSSPARKPKQMLNMPTTPKILQ
jgi:hypothetical protein